MHSHAQLVLLTRVCPKLSLRVLPRWPRSRYTALTNTAASALRLIYRWSRPARPAVDAHRVRTQLRQRDHCYGRCGYTLRAETAWLRLPSRSTVYTNDTDGLVVSNVWLIYYQRGGLVMGLPSRRSSSTEKCYLQMFYMLSGSVCTFFCLFVSLFLFYF